MFFALFPNRAVRERLAEAGGRLETECGGRKIRPHAIHLTLVFVGDVAIGRIEGLKQAIQSIAVRSFDLTLDTVCFWKRNCIVSLQPSRIPVELLLLVDALETALSGAGFNFDRRGYQPHVTLIRKAIHAHCTGTFNPILFRAAEWLLVQSKVVDRQIRYIPLGRWRLG